MSRIIKAAARALSFAIVLLPTFTPATLTRAGEPPRHWRRTVVVTRACPRPAPASNTTLGTFQPTPTIWIGGSYPTGRGYSPMDIYGDQTLTLYGPLSAFRVSTAPVLGYTRGYDGQLHLTETNSFSYPNLPETSPVVYPNDSSYFYGPRVNKTPRWGVAPSTGLTRTDFRMGLSAMQDVLTAAIEMHRSGQLGQASQLYQKILAREQENPEALHLLGVLNHQQGQNTRAIELIGRAVALRPNSPIYHANLAEAYRALGDFERAAGCCRAALGISPDYPEALSNLGAALQGLGQHAESIDQLRRALELRPDFVVAHNNLGIGLRELGQTDEALEHFRRAVDLDPSFAPAQTNLGQILVDRGQAEEALPHCQEAVRLDPNSAALHHNLGNALRALERNVDAKAEYLEALRLNPKLAVANAHLGLVLQREGQLADALVWIKKGVELEPDNADIWGWMAELYDDMEEPVDSIPCWERVLELKPDRAGAHLSLGWALQEEGRLNEAREHYDTAIRLKPDHAGVYLNLGGLAEEIGDLAGAEAAFRTALKLQPAYALPHARLATLLRTNLPAEDLAALEQRLADQELPEGPRGRLLFALAQALDGLGDHTRAAQCLREANALSIASNIKRRDYDPVEHERFIDELLSGFDRDLFARLANAGSSSRRPVFVFGLPRSGTTLIEQVLASHSQIHGAGELRLARRSFEAIPGLLRRLITPRDCIPLLDPPTVQSLARLHLENLNEHDGGRNPRIVDKMPDNYMYIGLLAIMFPKAVFVHSRRDLRDIAVSCWMTDFRSIRWANDQTHIARRFQQYHRVMNHWREVLPVPIHEVSYEETVADLESVARRLIEACGLAWEPACLEFHRTERPVRTASVMQVRQPVYQRSVARWKHYEPDLAEFFAQLPQEKGASPPSCVPTGQKQDSPGQRPGESRPNQTVEP